MTQLMHGPAGRANPALARTYLLQGGSVAVPADFMGQHFHYVPWVNGRIGAGGLPKNRSPDPTYGYKWTRTHDWGWTGGIHWCKWNPADGVYDWTLLDEFNAYYTGLGVKWMLTFFGMPAWLSSSAVPDVVYGYPGGTSPPTDVTKMGAAMAAARTRYGSNIAGVEFWNEPDSPGFWLGTKDQMAAMARQVKLNAGSIPVIGPALVGGPTGQMPDWLRASDGSGGQLKDHLNAVSIHTYFSAPHGVNKKFPSGSTPSYIGQHITQARGAMTAAGLAPSFPLYVSETGYDVPELTDAENIARGDEIGQYYKRIALEVAFRGCQMLQFYAHDDGFGGNPSISPRLAAHLAEIAATLPGKTIVELYVQGDGRYVARFADGGLVVW